MLDIQRILIVEDEFLIRLSLAEALTEEGFAVSEAESADQALPMLQAGPGFDLLVTDIQFPGVLDGTALARAARAAKPELPIIYMSGRPIADTPISTIDVVISKPYAVEEVCRVARQLLESNPIEVDRLEL